MDLILTADYREEPGVGFIGWCNEIKGIVAQGKTKDAVKKDLLELISIKFEIVKRELSAHEPVDGTETIDLARLKPV